MIEECPILVCYENNILRITLNRPHNLNALDASMADSLLQTLIDNEYRDNVRAIILDGKGSSFMAGGDLEMFVSEARRTKVIQSVMTNFHEIIRRIRDGRVPVIAAVHGYVAGGGVALALSCDFILASTDTVFVPAYMELGICPDGGTTWLVPNMIGHRRALEWYMLGEHMAAPRALELGMINKIFPPNKLKEEAVALATRIVQGPAPAQSVLKKLISQSHAHTLIEQQSREKDAFMQLAQSSDFSSALHLFLKRKLR